MSLDSNAKAQIYTGKRLHKCLITGPQWVGQNYFNHFYRPRIEAALCDPDLQFILGDADGVDTLAQQYLAQKNAHDRVTVYIRAGKTARLADKRFKVDATSTSFPARDMLMAESASKLIAVLPQFGNLVTGASLPIYAMHTGLDAIPIPSDGSCDKDDPLRSTNQHWLADASAVSTVLQNRMLEISPTFQTQAQDGANSALRDALLARNILQLLRTYSEPEDKALTTVVALLYEMWYAPSGTETAVMEALFVSNLRAKLAPPPPPPQQQDDDVVM